MSTQRAKHNPLGALGAPSVQPSQEASAHRKGIQVPYISGSLAAFTAVGLTIVAMITREIGLIASAIAVTAVLMPLAFRLVRHALRCDPGSDAAPFRDRLGAVVDLAAETIASYSGSGPAPWESAGSTDERFGWLFARALGVTSADWRAGLNEACRRLKRNRIELHVMLAEAAKDATGSGCADILERLVVAPESCRTSGRTYENADFSGCNLVSSNLGHSKLVGINLGGSNLSDADLAFARLTNVNLEDSSLRGVDLAFARLTNVNLERSSLRGADLKGAVFSDVRASGASFARVAVGGYRDITAFKRTVLTNADFSGIRTSLGKWSAASSPESSHHEPATFTLEFVHCDLSRADFRSTDLSSVTFADCDAQAADFSDAVWHTMVLRGSNLSGAIFAKAGTRKVFRMTRVQYRKYTGNWVHRKVDREMGRTPNHSVIRYDRTSRLELTDCNFRGADLHNAKVQIKATRCDFARADINGTDLTGHFEACVLEYLVAADMAERRRVLGRVTTNGCEYDPLVAIGRVD